MPITTPDRSLAWSWDDVPVPIRADILGDAHRDAGTILLLPPPSTVSSRSELAPLAERLSGSRRTICLDWPGFGTGTAHPDLPYGPELLHAFLWTALDRLCAQDDPTILAVGHAGGIALRLARARPGRIARLVLVAPTWRGPLPTMGAGPRLRRTVLRAIRAPVIGHALYRLNVSAPMVATMYRRHVYADAARITPAFVARKSRIAARSGGRFASGAFVTGALDPVADRDAFLGLADAVTAAGMPIHLVYGADTPRRSLAEMDALAARPGITAHRLPHGSLGLHEEDPDAVLAACPDLLAPTPPTD